MEWVMDFHFRHCVNSTTCWRPLSTSHRWSKRINEDQSEWNPNDTLNVSSNCLFGKWSSSGIHWIKFTLIESTFTLPYRSTWLQRCGQKCNLNVNFLWLALRHWTNSQENTYVTVLLTWNRGNFNHKNAIKICVVRVRANGVFIWTAKSIKCVFAVRKIKLFPMQTTPPKSFSVDVLLIIAVGVVSILILIAH